MNSARIFLASFLLFGMTKGLYGQFGGYNLAEIQFGGFPQDSDNRFTVYDRILASYRYNSFRISSTLEQFTTPSKSSRYLHLSQFQFQYKSLPVEIKIGNFYETIGRGLMLRGFEIPGATLEDLSYRSRHYFHRDILGFNLLLRHNNLKTQFLYGKPLNYVFPPTSSFEDRRPDTIGALSLNYGVNCQILGASTMYHTDGDNESWYAMVSASGEIANYIYYYSEIAKNISDFELSNFSNNSPFAIYGSLSLSHNRIGISTEYKHYNNFSIGSGFNEPPALVKEHSYKTLNRSTHVLEPANESGYQIELFYTFPNLSVLTLNHTVAINEFDKKYRFSEYFLEYSFTLQNQHEAKIFADFANDPIKLENQRFSTGSYFDWKISNNFSLKSNYEYQIFNREKDTVQNHVLLLGFSYKSKLFFLIEGELTNDSFLTEEDLKYWLGASARYLLKNGGHSIQLFAGERRGGPACSAGVCYEVLDFKGIELRISSRL